MSTRPTRILIAGGTGFVGEALRQKLRDDGYAVRLLVRSSGDAEKYGANGFETAYGDILDAQSLYAAMDGVDAVINLVAIIRESGDATFELINYKGTANLVDAACQAGIGRFVQMSALGAENLPDYPYHYTKWRAETYVRDRIPHWTIIRPSIVFGPSAEGNFQFVAQLADLFKKGPVVPVPGDGGALFQPIHVDDVAAVFSKVLDSPGGECEVLEIGGPDVLTYREMLQETSRAIGIKKRFVNVPIPLVRFGAAVMGLLPIVEAPVTSSQLDMLQIDNTTSNNDAKRLLGRPPRAFKGGLEFLRTQY